MKSWEFFFMCISFLMEILRHLYMPTERFRRERKTFHEAIKKESGEGLKETKRAKFRDFR